MRKEKHKMPPSEINSILSPRRCLITYCFMKEAKRSAMKIEIKMFDRKFADSAMECLWKEINNSLLLKRIDKQQGRSQGCVHNFNDHLPCLGKLS